MKRALLIAGGTVGGLGAVLSITPPQFGNSSPVSGGIVTSGMTTTTSAPAASATPAAPATTAPAATQTQAATSTSDTAAAKKAAAAAKKAAAAAAAAAKKAADAKAAATAATKAAAPAAVSGTFTGSVAQTRFGNVQVQITVSNGKITNAQALQYPNRDFRSQSISQQAIPYLIQETLAAQSSNIQGVGGASYTSQGWYDSLVSALAKAGMK